LALRRYFNVYFWDLDGDSGWVGTQDQIPRGANFQRFHANQGTKASCLQYLNTIAKIFRDQQDVPFDQIPVYFVEFTGK
jgi:hypothetical protein